MERDTYWWQKNAPNSGISVASWLCHNDSAVWKWDIYIEVGQPKEWNPGAYRTGGGVGGVREFLGKIKYTDDLLSFLFLFLSVFSANNLTNLTYFSQTNLIFSSEIANNQFWSVNLGPYTPPLDAVTESPWWNRLAPEWARSGPYMRANLIKNRVCPNWATTLMN